MYKRQAYEWLYYADEDNYARLERLRYECPVPTGIYRYELNYTFPVTLRSFTHKHIWFIIEIRKYFNKRFIYKHSIELQINPTVVHRISLSDFLLLCTFPIGHLTAGYRINEFSQDTSTDWLSRLCMCFIRGTNTFPFRRHSVM